MKKKIASIIAIAMALFILTSCNLKTIENAENDSPTSMFVRIETGNCWYVVYHKETKVMYAVSRGSHNYGTFTQLVDKDGKPLLYKN